MHPDVHRSKSQKRLKACGHAFPTDHQAAIFLLEPSTGALSLKAWNDFFDRSPPGLFRLPDALRDLGPDTPLPELLPQCLRIIAFIRCDHVEPFAGAATFAGADLHGVKQRYYLCPLISM